MTINAYEKTFEDLQKENYKLNKENNELKETIQKLERELRYANNSIQRLSVILETIGNICSGV